MIILDTCVVSEAIKPLPDGRVLAWLDTLDEDTVYLCAITVGELRRGIELLDDGRRREALYAWFESLLQRFEGRILGLDAGTLNAWGALSARCSRQGTPMPVMDGLMAACVLRSNALLATRNTGDFEPADIAVFNPWEY